MKGDGGTEVITLTILHGEVCTAVTFPVYSFRTVLVGEGINGNEVCNHECGVESQTEVTDDLILVALVLELGQEVGSTGESNLIDVLLYFIFGHTNTIIRDGKGLLLGIEDDMYFGLITCRDREFTHCIKLLQFGNCIAGVRNQFSKKDIVVRI